VRWVEEWDPPVPTEERREEGKRNKGTKIEIKRY
jgi:hypothetical protein